MAEVADKQDEILKVLDENGNPTDGVVSREEAHKNRVFHNEVTLWVIDKKRKKVLLEIRSANKEQGKNKLGLCAGHVVGDETIEEALFKEASEEIGLDLKKYEVHPLARIKRVEPNNHCFSSHFYVFENKPVEEYTAQESELSKVLYMDYEEFKTRMKNGDPEISYKCQYGEWDKVFEKLDDIILKENAK